MEKDVRLRITGRIVNYEKGREVHHDVMEFFTEGKMASRGSTTKLIYPEMEETGLEGCVTELIITPRRVRMHRRKEDEDRAILEFEQGKRYTGVYATPYGMLDMELLTNSIRSCRETGEPPFLSIDYSMSLKGIAQSRNMLEIEILKTGDNRQ